MAYNRRNIKKRKVRIPNYVREMISYLAFQFSHTFNMYESIYTIEDLRQELYELYLKIKNKKFKDRKQAFFISFKNHLINLYRKEKRRRKNEKRMECGTNP